MKFDSVLNLQADIFKTLFDFVELPASADLETSAIPVLVDPRVLDESIVQVEPIAISESAPEFKPIADVTEKQVLATERRAGKIEKRETDELALGIGHKGAQQDDGYELVVIYQDRRLKKSRLLERIAKHCKGEMRLVYGGRVRASGAWHRELNSTLRMGSSVGHFRITAGTLGCFVQHRETGANGLLSNNHVLANVNRGKPGDEIRQPGRSDDGSPADRIASLRAFVPIQFGGMTNLVDAAWASFDQPPRSVNASERFDSADISVGKLMGSAPRDILPGEFVMKIGRTTGYTQGEVDAINVNNLNVDMGAGAVARFDNQIQITSLNKGSFSAGGDSGSLIVNTQSEPVGLLFAGSRSGGFENAGFTWANPIATVLDQLGLNIVR
ncbi:MAG: hypothetical protein ABJN26_07400 [Stappiaceae bacterium]